MTALQLATYIRFELKMNTTTLPDTDLLPIVNMWMWSMAHKIVGVSEDYFGVVATTSLVSGQRQYMDPVDLIKMKYFEAKFDGTNWVKLSEFDLSHYQKPTDETTILSRFSNSEGHCFFDRFGNSSVIYSGSIDDVSDGLKLHYIAYPAILSNLTDNTLDLSEAPDSLHSGFPRQFQELLARRVGIDVKGSGDVPKTLTQSEQFFIKDFDDSIDDICRVNLDGTVTSSIPDDGSDNGFNY